MIEQVLFIGLIKRRDDERWHKRESVMGGGGGRYLLTWFILGLSDGQGEREVLQFVILPELNSGIGLCTMYIDR
jgi:hypothetical protein